MSAYLPAFATQDIPEIDRVVLHAPPMNMGVRRINPLRFLLFHTRLDALPG
jgi:hypothetical protein